MIIRPYLDIMINIIRKDFKKWYSQLPCLALSKIEIVWKTSRQACFLCPWARQVTGCLDYCVWQTGGGVKQSTRRGGSSLTEDLQTKRER